MTVPAQAQQIASHSAYEFERLNEDARELQTLVGTVVSSGRPLPGTGSNQEAVNRALESLLLHARNVYDFFFVAPRNNCPDVSVPHFFEDGQVWTPDLTQLCPYLDGQRERLNRSIQHLSYDRLAYEPTKDWNISTLVTELAAVWDDFLSRLPPGRRQWFARPVPPPAQQPSPSSNLCARTQPTVIDVRTL
jgi:hypothetical protein